MKSVVFAKCLVEKFDNSFVCSRRIRVAERDGRSTMRTPSFLSILVASACLMVGSVAMPANAQATVNSAGGGDVYLLWLWVSILIIGPAVVGVAFAFDKRTI